MRRLLHGLAYVIAATLLGGAFAFIAATVLHSWMLRGR